MKHLLTIAALLALSSPVMAQEAATAPATPPVEAAAPAAPVAPAEQPPVILFRQVTEVPIRPEEIEVDGTVSCTLIDAVLRCTAARRLAPAPAPPAPVAE